MKTKIVLPVAAALLTAALINSCAARIPKGAVAVKSFDAEKYLGKWHEIARYDYFFEKGLVNCTAEYSMNSDGTIKIVNRGYKASAKKWKQSVGEARFVKNSSVAQLKVAFFKPFWAGYNVLSVDGDYKYALVAGDNLNYLWILSRETSVPDQIKEKYLNLARGLGYNTDKLLWPTTH